MDSQMTLRENLGLAGLRFFSAPVPYGFNVGISWVGDRINIWD